MSELEFYLRPCPAIDPISTRGNAFYRGNERFLIKGINYFIRTSPDPSRPPNSQDPKIDCLCPAQRNDLARDIWQFRDLRLNTVSVSHLDPELNHGQAIRSLAEAGLYVLVGIGEDVVDSNSDSELPVYSAEQLRNTLRLVDELADHPNVLGFVVSGDCVFSPASTKRAEVVRACVRDVREFIRRRGGRRVAVGVATRESIMIRQELVRYFTAGSQEQRAEFVALECWSWAYRSSFEISGWKNMVASLEQFPVPMLLGEYGSYTGKQRIWQEVECLYSPDMTGVFSGGCAYAFHGYGNKYGVVRFSKKGVLREKPEFETLKQRFREVNRRASHEVAKEEQVKRNDDWTGEFPQTSQRWLATKEMPEFPLDWARMIGSGHASAAVSGVEAATPETDAHEAGKTAGGETEHVEHERGHEHEHEHATIASERS